MTSNMTIEESMLMVMRFSEESNQLTGHDRPKTAHTVRTTPLTITSSYLDDHNPLLLNFFVSTTSQASKNPLVNHVIKLLSLGSPSPPLFGASTQLQKTGPLLSPIPVPSIDSPAGYSEEDILNEKGPSRLIGFLVTQAMDPRTDHIIRWTGKGLEFYIANQEKCAIMWGKRKHNSQPMTYSKLSRAIREKYDNDKRPGAGQLKKGSRTYAYEFTPKAYDEMKKHTNKTIEEIQRYAERVGLNHRG